MQIRHSQKGLALLMLVFVLALVAIAYAVNALDFSGIQNERNKQTTAALAEAKDALIGSVIGRASVNDRPYLPNPSLALTSNSEGYESLAPFGGAADISLVGKFPWRSLGSAPIRDGSNECLWYAVSGRYKNTPQTLVFNWDTQGQITVIDANSHVVASNLAALIIAPGPSLKGQNRYLASADYRNCGGNFDARNYLDTFNIGDAIGGVVNYFFGSVNNRQASGVNNKTFVLARNDYYNDQFIFVTVDDVFDAVVKRSDFDSELNNAAEDIEDYSLVASGTKGTANIDCSPSGITLKTNADFCENWKEMFLLKEGGVVNGSACGKVFIFGGKKIGLQTRATNADKMDPINYLEGDNLGAFNGEVGKVFSGNSVFDWKNPSADVLKCIP